MSESLQRLQKGVHHDPFELLGRHPQPGGGWIIRSLLPSAETASVIGGGEMRRVEGTDIFEYIDSDNSIPQHYELRYVEKGKPDVAMTIVSPYTFAPQIGDLDMHLFNEGRHQQVWNILGANARTIDGIDGVLFAVWAPAVRRVSLVGDFNAWDGRRHQMRCRGSSGIWELFVPGLGVGEAYKFEILGREGQLAVKTDPYARQMGMRPETVSRVPATSDYDWQDGEWLEARRTFDWQHEPVSIYELHAGSWQRDEDGGFLDWRTLADRLVPYLLEMNYTHLELMPVAEHPLDESWGYQVSGYYAPTARYGSPDDFRYFVDQCHRHGIGVMLDWVPAHFPRDDFALARFIGEPLYEHADPRRGEHQDWGTLIFDYGRNEVRNFLVANALYWIEEFHIDGLRVDAVASMLYLDYSRNEGEWLPNQFGGRENLDAIVFLRELNQVVHSRFPGVLTIAEESTAWPMVSRPIELGGLGFTMKWNMGWMNDSLAYIENDPVHRKYHHNLLTFSQLYAWTENFVLPLSHDEVVHLKRSMLSKMPGDYWQKMANLRLFYCWQYAHPGKKLLFMGSELGQWHEWNQAQQVDWPLLQVEAHAGIRRLVIDLNRLYRDEPSLHRHDFESSGFRWIDCHDTEQSVLSFIRSGDDGEAVLCILNFTPVPRHHYRLGVPRGGSYRELLNSDSGFYGGTNNGNGGNIPVQETPWMGFEHSIEINLPPLAALFLKAN
ncbi:MAG: 1,4-alpha-glucan branching protein GlgB [Gammaproteobacteria bacterium]|jgi:1,4-alpha-glucan branching enzyme